MLLLELECNTDPATILQNIANHIDASNIRKQDCHSSTGNAIMNGTATDKDYIVVLGHGNSGTHSIIVDDAGNIKEDSFKDRIKDVDHNNFKITYYATKNKDPRVVWDLTPVEIISVGKFKRKYL